MKIRKEIKIVLWTVISVCFVLGSGYSLRWLSARHIHKRNMFYNIGREMAAYLDTSTNIPQKLDALYTSDFLSEKEIRFIKKNPISYYQPTALAASNTIILTYQISPDTYIASMRSGTYDYIARDDLTKALEVQFNAKQSNKNLQEVLRR